MIINGANIILFLLFLFPFSSFYVRDVRFCLFFLVVGGYVRFFSSSLSLLLASFPCLSFALLFLTLFCSALSYLWICYAYFTWNGRLHPAFPSVRFPALLTFDFALRVTSAISFFSFFPSPFLRFLLIRARTIDSPRYRFR